MMRIIKVFLLGFLCFSFISCITSSATSRAQEEEEKRIIIVSDIQNLTDNLEYNNIVERLTTHFRNALFKTHTFRIIERERLTSILDEIQLSMSDLFNTSNMIKIGDFLGADSIMFVELYSLNIIHEEDKTMMIYKVNDEIDIKMNARLVDIATGEIIVSTEVEEFYENDERFLGRSDKERYDEAKEENMLALMETIISDSTTKLADKIAVQYNRYQ